MEQVWSVPLFPLPNVVLFPRAVLPLHIFEQRYRVMTADALLGDKRIAMALLQPGWEADYHAQPEIEPVVCVGRILSCERLADGRYNLLLQGEARATVIEERLTQPGGHRMARVHPMRCTEAVEIDLANHRQRLMEIFCCGPLAGTAAGKQFKRLLASAIGTAEVADLLAFNILEDVAAKQSLLADEDVARRVGRLVSMLETAVPAMEAVYRAEHPESRVN